MKRALIVLAIVGAGHVAEARGRSCHEVSSIVGYQRCTRFGYWSRGATFWWDLGLVTMRFDPKPIDGFATARQADGTTTQYHLVSAPGDDRSISTTGLRFRDLISFGHAWYVGGELDLTSITDGPTLVADVTARGATMTMDTGTHGFVSQNKVIIGRHVPVGPLTFAGELGPGFRIASYQTSALPDQVRGAAQAWFVLEAHAKVDAWIAPNFSLGVSGGVDLVHARDVSLALTLGLHLTPYDRTR